jgi:hypothetical protein
MTDTYTQEQLQVLAAEYIMRAVEIENEERNHGTLHWGRLSWRPLSLQYRNWRAPLPLSDRRTAINPWPERNVS